MTSAWMGVGIGIFIIWSNWRERSWHLKKATVGQRQAILVMAGVWVGSSMTILMDTYLPLLVQHIDSAFEWFQFIGLGGFMLLVGGIALAMRWALDKW